MEEHYCVECYETMLSMCRQLKLRDSPSAVLLPGHPIFEVMYYIDCEERSIVRHPGLGPLPEDTHYGIELFKARWLWNRRQANPNYVLNDSPGRPEFIGYLPGRDPKSLYVNTDGSRYRGKYMDGTVAEIPSDEVDNCSLSQALTRLVQRRVAHEDAKRERVRLITYNHYAYDDPLDDPRLSEPAAPARVNPRVPVLRMTQGPGPNTSKSGSQLSEAARRDAPSLTAAGIEEAESTHAPNGVTDQAGARDESTTFEDTSIDSPGNLTSKGSDAPATAPPPDPTPAVTSAGERHEPTSPQSETTDSPSNLTFKASDTLTTLRSLGLATSDGKNEATEEGLKPKEDISGTSATP